ncbi:hypothetical protein ABIB73_001881 [Bradyrhizobium sp. F1.4.3]
MPGLVPGMTFFVPQFEAWMAGSSPAMTMWKQRAQLGGFRTTEIGVANAGIVLQRPGRAG